MSLIPLGFWAASGGGAAGAFDLLETQILTSSASSVTFTGLDSYAADYKHLQIRATTQDTSTTTLNNVFMTFNGDTSSSYSYHYLEGTGTTVASGGAGGVGFLFPAAMPGTLVSNNFSASVIDILDFGNVSKNTTFRSLSGWADSGGPTLYHRLRLYSGAYFNTNAITSINIYTANAFNINSRFSIYGIRG